jgi:hypothetical protein
VFLIAYATYFFSQGVHLSGMCSSWPHTVGCRVPIC